jgi:hypothetical protein
MGVMRRSRGTGAIWLVVGVAVLVAAAGPALAAKAKTRDLVVLDTERWLDSLKGTVKNFSKASARDVTVVVKFLDKKKKPLGTQRVSVGDLRSGEEGHWTLAIEERNRPAKHYEYTVFAIWQ